MNTNPKLSYSIYHGFDCNDLDGFNNGCYVDREVFTNDPEAYLNALVPADAIRYDCLCDGDDEAVTVAWYTGFYREGDEISYEEYCDQACDDESILATYQYLTATLNQ